MSHDSKKAVVTAIVANTAVTILKFLTAFAGGSPSMMNAAVHSLMNLLNQGVLFFGLAEAARPVGQSYTFGHAQKKHFWNLWSAVGLFSLGAGFGLAHAWYAWHGLNKADGPALVELFGIFFDPLGLALLILCLAFIIEGYAFIVALKALLSVMRRDGCSNPFRHIVESRNPMLAVVVLEEFVAMLGLVLAVVGIGLSAITGNLLWDVGFSALIAVMLGSVAFYLGMVNMRSLAETRL